MRTELDIDALASSLAKAVPEFDEEQERIALASFRRLAQGSPAPPADIAARSGVSADRVHELLRTWPGIFLNGDGHVVGFWGLTIQELSPTHSIIAGDTRLFGWCAWDTLFLTEIIGTNTQVESTCPTTGETISLRVSPSGIVETSHPEAVVSFLLPERDFDVDIIQSFCHFVHFFASAEAGEAWTEKHLGTFLLTLDQAFELGHRANALNFPSEFGGDR